MKVNLEFINIDAFYDTEIGEYTMKYIHAINMVQSGGEFTLCGVCFEGDGLGSTCASQSTDKKLDCPDCIKLIKFCKKIKIPKQVLH